MNTDIDIKRDQYGQDNHRSWRPSTGLCVCCDGVVFGSHFIEPRPGCVLCLECVRNGGSRASRDGASMRIIDETRARLELLGVGARDSDYLLMWARIMAGVRDELRAAGIDI